MRENLVLDNHGDAPVVEVSGVVYTDDCQKLYEQALAGGGTSVMAPMRLERWNCTIAMVADPDGYQLEMVQNDG